MLLKRITQASLTLALSSFLVACGAAPDRSLQSITLATAVAGPGQLTFRFIATDHWTATPKDTPPLAPVWGVCASDEQPTTAVTVTQTGAATCGKNSTGTYTIFVEDPRADTGPVCNLIDACGRGCQISGSTQLSCP